MATLGVQIVGDAAGLKAALGQSLIATERWASATEGQTVRVTEAFKGVSTATLQTAAAQDKLAIAYARYGAGTLGAAQATVRYRRELDALRAAQLSSASAVARGLTTGFTLPLAAIGYEATKMAVTFQRDMLLIQTQAGASAGEVKRMTAALLELAPAVGISPDEAAKGLYHLESIGLRGAKALNTLKISALAARMGLASLEDVSTALGGVVVTGIKGAHDYKEALGTLIAGVGAGNMRFEDLAQHIGGVAPAAAAAGMTLKELMAAMATLTDRGFSVEEAVTRLRMTIGAIQSPSKAATKALGDMGVNAKSLGGILREPGGLLKVLELLRAAIQKVGQARGNRDLLEGFGRARSGLGIQTLVQSLDSSVSNYKDKVDQVMQTQGRFGSNLDTYMKSPAFKLHQALATLETDLTKLGTSLLPGVTVAAHDAAKIFDGLAKIIGALPGPAKQALGILVAELAVAGPLALGVIGVTRLIGSLRTAIGMLPATAGPAAAAAGTEISTGVGAGVTAAEGEVAALRMSLLGLGALAIAPIVIPIEYKYAASKYNPLRTPLEHVGAFLAGSSDTKVGPVKRELDAAVAILANGGTPNDVAAMLYRRFGIRDHQTAEAILHDAEKLLSESTPSAAGGAGSEAAAKAAAGVAHSAATQAAAAAAGRPKTPTTPHYTLSRLQELNLALAENPNSRAAIEAKLAYDREAAAFAEKRLKEGRGSKGLYDQLRNVLADENSLQSQLDAMDKKTADARKKKAKAEAKAARTLNIPLDLQLAEAKANASGVQSKQAAAAEAIKKWAEGIVHSKKTTEQQLIDAYNIIAQENNIIGVHSAAYAVKVSSMQFVAGIKGLTGAEKKEIEARYAQLSAHGGYMPTGHGILGQTVVINVHGAGNPDAVANRVLHHLQKHGKHGTAQRRGPNAGKYLGLH